MKKLQEFTKDLYLDVSVAFGDKKLGLSIAGNKALLLWITVLTIKIIIWIWPLT